MVELLIVIVILGILSTVTVFAVKGMTDKAKTNTCAEDKRDMQAAIEGYYAQNGAYAASGAALVPSFLRVASTNFTTDNTGAVTAISGNSNGCS